MQRQKSSYNGGSFKRSSTTGLPTSSNKVMPSNDMDDLEKDYEDELEQYLPQDNIPIIEATVVTTAPMDDLEDEEFANFVRKADKSRAKSSQNLRAKSNRALERIPSNQSNNNNKSFRGNLPKAWPPALRKRIIDKLRDNYIDGAKADKFLAKHNWPRGLRDTVARSCTKLPLRFFLVDDSGSMIINDGKRLVQQGNSARLIKCTRWAELTETMLFQAELSESLQVVSDFRLLNGADPVIVGLGDDDGESLKFFREVLSESPAGPTPLCMHIEAIVQCIQSVEHELRANGQKAVVMIATDGESSDGNVAEALRPLTNLPVLVIIRLCTEENEVVEYWNNIDNQLELDIDVLDDLLGDAKQVGAANGWLTYGEPLHRLREFGASMKEMDIIDESTLSTDQMRVLCAYIFSIDNVKDIPHPGVDWRGFVNKIKELNAREARVFDAVTQQMKPWVDTSQLPRFYIAESSAAKSSCIIS